MKIMDFNWSPSDIQKMDPLHEVKYLVLHHTDSNDVSVKEVDRWHKTNGWIGVGYHYLIRANGGIEKGRPDDKQGAHVKGYNQNSIGIALTGKLSKQPPTPAQINSLKELLLVLLKKYPSAPVRGHMRFSPTECPGNLFPWDDLWKWMESANQKDDYSKVPKWAMPAMQWAVSNQLVNTPMGAEDFYRAITVLHAYDKMKK